MISTDAQQLAALIRAQFGLHDLLPHLVRRLAAAGEPMALEHIAETGGWTVEQVPSGADPSAVQAVRKDIEGRVQRLLVGLLATTSVCPRGRWRRHPNGSDQDMRGVI